MMQSLAGEFKYEFIPTSEHSLKEWASRISSLISPMEVLPESRGKSYQALWHHIPLGPTDLNFFGISESQLVAHKPSSDQSYELLYLHRGGMELVHARRHQVLTEGSFVLVDNREPWEFWFNGESSCLTMHLEAGWLRRWLACPERLVAQAVHRDSSWGRPLSATLTAIHDESEASRANVPRQIIAESLGGLIALLLGSQDGTVAGTRYQMNLNLALERVLHDCFDEAGLTAEQVAERLGVSKRQLHNICSKGGRSFASMLMDIRLERARLMLDGAQYRAYRICEIAWVCGFADPSHFGRRFRAANGMPPEQYRQRNGQVALQ